MDINSESTKACTSSGESGQSGNLSIGNSNNMANATVGTSTGTKARLGTLRRTRVLHGKECVHIPLNLRTYEALEFVELLGTGNSGDVYRGFYEGQEVAIKVLQKDGAAAKLDEFRHEFLILLFLLDRLPEIW